MTRAGSSMRFLVVLGATATSEKRNCRGFRDICLDAIVTKFGESELSSVRAKHIYEISTACSSLDELLNSPAPSEGVWTPSSDFASAKSFEPNEVIFKAGNTHQYWFLLSAGVVRRYKTLADGRRQILGFSIPGDWIASSLGEEFSFSADAVDAVRACSFNRDSVIAVLGGQPKVLARFHDLAHAELAAAEEHMLLLGRRRSEEKIACFLLTMRERWAQLGKRSVTVHLPMSRRDIADYLGVTTETVSRTLARFARDGIILLVPEGVRLLDTGSLEQLSGLEVSTK